MSERTNGIATAADFRKLMRFEITLPSGRKVLMRMPSGKFILLHLPRFQTVAARLVNAEKEPPSEQEVNDFEDWMDLLLVDVVVEPRVSLAPKDESELHPREIPALDRLLIFRVAVGEIGPSGDGPDLAEFRGKAAGTTPTAGASGGDVPLPPESDAQPDGDDGGVPV
jgi:hypothetical protein